MKNKLVKILCMLLSLVCLCSVFGCYDTSDTVKIDKTKTQLYVGLVPSGYGNTWLHKAIDRFEKEYAEYEFEPGSGKKGAQVIIDDVSYGNNIDQGLSNARYSVIYTSDVDYFDLISRNLIYDMTTILNEDFADKDELGNDVENSVMDKFVSQTAIDAYSVNGKIYGVPFVGGSSGISYDRDLFEDKGLFFIASDPDNGNYSAYVDPDLSTDDEKVWLLSSNKANGETIPYSMGRDGVPGTYDDGLPATYEQFYFLMKKIVSLGMTPITWSGNYHASYLTQFIGSVWADNAGAEDMSKFFTMTGTSPKIIDHIDADGTIYYESEFEIDNSNAWKLQSMESKYQALEFLDNIIKILRTDSKGYDMAFKESIDHLGAQDNFLKSVTRSENDSTNYKRIAMFYDGSYWENEARNTFNGMKGYGRFERNIGYMPIPHPTTEGAGGITNEVKTSTLMFMNANVQTKYPEQLLIATKFVQFMHTRESLVEFTQETSMIRPFNFTITKDDRESMSYFGQNQYDMFKASDLLITSSTNSVYRTNYDYFKIGSSNSWKTVIGSQGDAVFNPDSPSVAFKNNITAKEYFEGVKKYYTKDNWDRNILKIG